MDINWQKHGSEALSYLKGIGNKVKQVALQLTEIEVKVEDATNNEPWGPHGKDMAEITKASYELENYKQIMGVIARRLQDQGEEWRHVYKSLLLLEYMSKHGPQKVVEEIVSNVGVIEKLTNFQHKDANGKDWGLNVRQRAKELIALVTDTERIRSERQKAKANATKYTGVSSDDLKSGGFGAKSSGFGSSAASTFGLSRKYSGGLGSPGLGSTGGFGSGSRSYHDYDEPYDSTTQDPKEATRERIERLKKEGAVEFEEASNDKGAIPPPKVPVLKQGRAAASEAKAEELKGPKKLSEFKVNPSIAAALGQLPGGALQTPQARAASNGTIPAVHAQAEAPADLLLELDAPAAAAPALSEGQDEWDAFAGGEGSAASKPAASDDWMSGFSAGSNGAGSASASSDPFGQLSGPSSAAPAHRLPTAADPFAQLSAPGPSAAPAQQQSADPFAGAFSATTSSASGHATAATRAAPPLPALSDDFFSMPPQPGPSSMGGMQDHLGPSSAGDFGMFGGQPQAAPLPQAQKSFGSMQQSSGGFGSFTQPFPAPSAVGASTGPSTSKPAAQGNSFSHGPLNPAATQALGGPSKSKDPFADLASLGSAF